MTSPDSFSPLDPVYLASSASLPERPRRARSQLYGGGRLATAADLAPVLPRGPARPAHATVLEHVAPLTERARGQGELEALYGSSLVFDEERRNCHFLVVGQPGSGKTTRLVLPLIASDLKDPARSVVIFDAKSNLEPVVRSLVERYRGGRGLVVLNPTDATRSVGWNPVRRGAGAQEIFGVAHQVCSAAETSAHSEDSPFWIGCSTKLLRDVLLGLQADPDDVACLGRAFELVHLDPRAFGAWVAAHDPTGRLARFVEFVSSGSHNAATILADVQMRLRVWLDRDVCAVTASHELDLDVLVDEPTVLLVEMDETQVETLRPLWNLLGHQVFDRLLARSLEFPGGRLPRPVSVVMDEFASSIGRVPDMQVRLNTLRERRVGVTAALQSLSQLEAVYGREWRPVLGAFSNRIFLSRLDREDAVYASGQSGTMTAECETEFLDRAADGVREIHRRQRTPVPRPVLLPDEIGFPPRHFLLGDAATLFLAGLRPFQAWLPPAWELDPLAHALAARAKGDGGRALREAPLAWPPAAGTSTHLRASAARAKARRTAASPSRRPPSTPDLVEEVRHLFEGIEDPD